VNRFNRKQVLAAVLWAMGIPFPHRSFLACAQATIPVVFMGIATLSGVLPAILVTLAQKPSQTAPFVAWDLAAMAGTTAAVVLSCIVVGNAVLFLWGIGILACASRLTGQAVDSKAASLRIVHLASCPQIGQTAAIGGLSAAAAVSSPAEFWSAVWMMAIVLLASSSLARPIAVFWRARHEAPGGILVPALLAGGCLDCWLALAFIARWAGW
jgi:hypothetical protein